MTRITHSYGIFPVPRDNMIVLRTRSANNATTAPAMMTTIELKGGKDTTYVTVKMNY